MIDLKLAIFIFVNIAIFGINNRIALALAEQHKANEDVVFGVYREQFEKSDSVSFFLSNNEFLKDYKEYKFDTIYIVGGFVPRGAYNKPHPDFEKLNVELVRKIILNYPTARFIYVSSIAVHGGDVSIINEGTQCNPDNLYGKSKLKAEQLIQGTSNYSIVRLTAVYGEKIRPNNFINRGVEQALQNKKIVIWGTGERSQNYIHFEDVAKYLYAASNYNGNRVFLAKGKRAHTNLEVGDLIATELNDTSVEQIGMDNSSSIYYDNETSCLTLDFEAEVSLEEGIRRIIANA